MPQRGFLHEHVIPYAPPVRDHQFGKEEVMGTAWATPAEKAAFSPHAQALKTELVRSGSLAVFSSVADSARCDAACAVLDHRELAQELLPQEQAG